MSEPTPDTPNPTASTDRAMIKADLLTGIVLLVFGLAVFYLAWDMPRLETRRIHPSTIPGLVPMMLGGALALCGFLLALYSARLESPARDWSSFGRAIGSPEAFRTIVLLGLVLVYTLVLVGRVPFWMATGLFVFAFIVLFETILNDVPKPLIRSMIWALVQAAIVATVVTLVFERGFLVRLP